MSRQLDLIGKPPRKSPRVLMHVTDAGDRYVQFTCSKCRHTQAYHGDYSVTEAKRGRPCPECNKVAL